MTALQIYKAALHDVLGVHSMECEGAKCFPRVMTRLQEALEAAAKVGKLADDERLAFVVLECMKRGSTVAPSESDAFAVLCAIDAYLRGAR